METPKTYTRQELYAALGSAEVIKFETEKGVPIRGIPLGKFLGKHATTGVSPYLIQQKVADLVMQGAENVVMHNNVARVVEMTSPKFEVPVMNYTDFKVYKGVGGTGGRSAGGFVDSIELDCSGQNGLYRVNVALDKTWIRDAQFSAIEEALMAAGESMYDAVLAAIVSKYETDVATGFTDTVANWGGAATAHYKALIKGMSLVKGERMRCDFVMVHPSEEYDLMISDYFIHASYAPAAGQQKYVPESGLIGYLTSGNIPIYSNPTVTTAKMTIGAKKGVVLGIRQDLTIENFNNVVEGQEGGVVTMQFDAKSGKDAKKTKPTAKAWAVATTA